MKACTVTYPVWYVWVGAFLVVLAALGAVEALHGTGHWTFFHVAVFAAVGMWWMAYYGVSRTVFSDDGIEQRTLLGVRRYSYGDVCHVGYGGRIGYQVFLHCSDGRSMTVSGQIRQLAEAHSLLQEKLSHLNSNSPVVSGNSR